MPLSMRRGSLPMPCGRKESLLYDQRDYNRLALFRRVYATYQLLTYPLDLRQGVELFLMI